MEFRPAGEGGCCDGGNVYEPFLGACHRFDIFVDRLLDGYTVAEASWMSMPVLSWQGLVFGDPVPSIRPHEGYGRGADGRRPLFPGVVGFLRAVRRPLEGPFRAFDGVRPEGPFFLPL